MFSKTIFQNYFENSFQTGYKSVIKLGISIRVSILYKYDERLLRKKKLYIYIYETLRNKPK